LLETIVAKVLFRETSAPRGSTAPDRAVVFVHGFTGTAADTWKGEAAGQSFCELLESDSEFADHDILLFQYKSKDLRPPSIPNIANQLMFVLKDLHYERIIFIAHSMGGLVVMDGILQALERGEAGKVAGLLFFGVPMNGVEWAKYAQLVLKAAGMVYPHFSWLTGFLNGNRQISALTKDSEFIESLIGKWVRRVLNGGDPSIPADQRIAFPVRVVSGNDDWVVKESSARGLYGEIDWINVDEDHRRLVKPADRSALTYQIATRFLKESRSWMTPALLLKLRTQIEIIWAFRQEETISNWLLDLEFDDNHDHTPTALPSDKRLGLGLSGFRPFRVLRCEYKRRLPSGVLRFGFAVGHIAAGSVWNETFVFLHRIYFSALTPELTGRLENAIRTVLDTDNVDRAWETIFDDVRIRIKDARGGVWHQLVPGITEITPECLIREYSLPPETVHLVGKEAIIHVSFRSVGPSASCDYKATFPWLCDGFTINVTVLGQPQYLLYSSGMRGTAMIQSIRQHQSKLQCSSADLILPGSTLQFEWGFEETVK
jgi:pimeloyl-ACP methyl ester carboxylesterase